MHLGPGERSLHHLSLFNVKCPPGAPASWAQARPLLESPFHITGQGKPRARAAAPLTSRSPRFLLLPVRGGWREGLGPILVFGFVTSRKATAHASAGNPFLKSSSGNARGCRTASETPSGNPEHPCRFPHCSSRDPAHAAGGPRRQEARRDPAVSSSTCWGVAWGGVGGRGQLKK